MQVTEAVAKIARDWSYGPDRLWLLWEIAACYFPLVIYNLLFLDNSLLCWKIVDFLPVISKIVDCMLVILPVIFKIVDSRLFTNTNTSHPNDYSRQLQKLQHLLKV